MTETQNQTLSIEEVRAIADLARLEMSDAEIERYAAQLSDILGYFTMLQEVDISDIEPIDSVLPLTSVMRRDEVLPAMNPEEVVANAPEAEDHQFRVKPVLGDE